MRERRPRASMVAILVIAAVVAACDSGQTATSVPSAAPASMAAITLEAPAEVAAGAEVQVAWTATPGDGDYLAILPAGATAMGDQPYANLAAGNPATLTVPAAPGDYEIVYIAGDTVEPILARRPIKVN